MPILFCYISQVINQWKFDTFISKHGENNRLEHLLKASMLFIYFHPNLFNVRKHLALVLKKIVHVVVYIFQTSLNKAVNISCKLPEWIRNIQMKQCFSTIKTWLRILHRFLHESCMIINKKYHNWSFSIFFVSVPLNYFCCRNFRVYEQNLSRILFRWSSF